MKGIRMKRIGTALAAILMIGSGLVSAGAATLRVGIQDDPDALDPALSGTYSGRFVFAALCDKLVDISPDLKIVPQLATGYEWEVGHLHSAQERHVPRRHRV
jgi:peptide/nickel transport system substrate-binding protein